MWQGLGCKLCGTESFSLTKTLSKNFPNASAFSEFVPAKTTLPYTSSDFRSPMCSWTLRLLFMYFQNTLGFSLH